MPLSWNEIKTRAATFGRRWREAADERAQAQEFWVDFFDIFGVRKPRVASFEHAVKKHGGGQGFIDLFWPGTLLVEHKSRGKSLERAHDQALDYFPGLKERDLPRYVLVTDFARMRLQDLERGEETEFALADLPRHIKRFAFVAGYRTQDIRPQDPVNRKAAERMGKLHDALKAAGTTGHPLEVLLVRLLFCLFADDTGIFQPAQAFRSWVEERTAPDGSDLGPQLAQLFQVLNTPESARSPKLDEQLRAFPYVNGALFAETLPMAVFDVAMREQLLEACALDWSSISPAIFGAMFQSISDDKARRALGAHYTSEENILKLIKPLFLDALWAEFERVKSQRNRLFEFHKKLRTQVFLDPACGCGNFLVITYRELRLLELEVLRAAYGNGQQELDVHTLINIDVDQFHGIEIEEFPAQIAQVALWLVDHQMNLRVSEEFGRYFARIPLKTSPHIVHGNALRVDWAEVVAPERCSYVLGNPPFVGHHLQSATQKQDQLRCFRDAAAAGVLDYVCCWYRKAAQYIAGSRIRCAFVSTNSITQGEQVGILWRALLAVAPLEIHFAHQTFRWSNEASGKAHVYCVVIGFGAFPIETRVLFEYEDIDGAAHARQVSFINAYLVDAPWVLLPNSRTNLFGRPEMMYGSKPTDGGHFFLDDAQRAELLAAEPDSAPLIRPFVGAQEYLNGESRWVLWLVDASPALLKRLPRVLERVHAVASFRQASKAASTRAYSYPTLFRQVTQPMSRYVLIPGHTSESRRYIPFGFMDPEVIVGNSCFALPEATAFDFGVIQSAMHMAWVRFTCGRLESRYRYSKDIVYNNFPWPEPTDAERKAIEAAAQAVLDARAQFPGSTLADLYDPLTMPPALLKAHQRLDAAVDAAYHAPGRKAFKSDAERVAFLFERYRQLTSLLPADAAPKPRRRGKAAPSEPAEA